MPNTYRTNNLPKIPTISMISQEVTIDGITYTVSVRTGEESLKRAVREFKKTMKDKKKRENQKDEE